MAIREHLNNARAALDMGDRANALSAVNAALAVDPDYLAAQALRDRIEQSPDTTPSPKPRTEPAGSGSNRAAAAPVPSDRQPVLPAQPPVVSAEGWARFEQRARNRRIERRVAAARLVINRRQFAEARAILLEIGDIDSGHPDLISLGIELDAEEHLAHVRRRRWGPAVAAVLILAAVISGARYLQSPDWTSAVPVPEQPASATPTDGGVAVDAARSADSAVPAATPAIETAATIPVVAALADSAIPDTGNPVRPPQVTTPALDEPSKAAAPAPPAPRPATVTADAVEGRPVTSASPPRDPVPTPTTGRIEWPPVLPVASPPAPPPAPPPFTPPPSSPAPAVAAATLPGSVAPEPSAAVSSGIVPRDADAERARSAAAAVIDAPRDEDLVRRTLQQYRAAYQSLDARSAQAVWPRVDEAALQRAFSGLESQRLTFDDCDVQVRGTTGLATCRGTMLYVPKVGSRDPRREPRVWTFDLRKVGENWQIDNARTAR